MCRDCSPSNMNVFALHLDFIIYHPIMLSRLVLTEFNRNSFSLSRRVILSVWHNVLVKLYHSQICTKTNIHNIEKPYRLASHMTIVNVVRCCYQRFLILVIGETAWFVFSFRMFPRILVEFFFSPWFLYSTPSTRNVIWCDSKESESFVCNFLRVIQTFHLSIVECGCIHAPCVTKVVLLLSNKRQTARLQFLRWKKNCFIKSLDPNSNSCLSFERETSTKWRANKSDNHDDISHSFISMSHHMHLSRDVSNELELKKSSFC